VAKGWFSFRASSQLQGVALEGAGVATPRVGEVEGHLAYDLAGWAGHAGNGQGDLDGLAADGHSLEGALLVAAWCHVS
jgi:hypothetical protein